MQNGRFKNYAVLDVSRCLWKLQMVTTLYFIYIFIQHLQLYYLDSPQSYFQVEEK